MIRFRTCSIPPTVVVFASYCERIDNIMARASPVALLVVLLLSTLVNSLPASPRCPGAPNPFPVWTVDPTLIKKVPNGKLYLAGAGNDTFYVQHLYGSYYDMGFAHGQHFSDIIPLGLNRFYDWVEGQIESKAPWLPAWVAGIVADFGVPFLMELVWNNTKPFTPQRYVDEMTGIANGAGVAVQDIFNINMVAELIKAQCSIIGANKNATMNSLNGSLVHLRTLDGMGGSTMPIKDYATVTVYHPSPDLKQPSYANFAWASFVGTVTGFGEFVGVGEKFWGSGAPFDKTHGEAWTFVTRDVLLTRTLEEAMSTLENAHRTCAVHLGIGARSTQQFRGVEMSGNSLTFFNDTSIPTYPQHPYFEGIVYWDKHSQPTPSYCFPDMFSMYYGNITAEILALQVAPYAETGSLHAAIFDYENQVAYFSNARKTYCSSGAIDAFARQYTRLDMGKLFKEQY